MFPPEPPVAIATWPVEDLSIEEVLSTPRSQWQRASIERVIGSIRRECLDHVIVINEGSLYRHVESLVAYTITRAGRTYRWRRTSPIVPESGRVIALPQVGGLHRR